MTNQPSFAAEQPVAATADSFELTFAVDYYPHFGVVLSHWCASFFKAGFTGQKCRSMRSLKKLERVSFIRFMLMLAGGYRFANIAFM